MGIWDVIVDAVEDVGETIVDGAEAVGSGIATVVDEVGPAAGAVGGAVGDTFGALATAIDASTGGALGEVLGATDDYIFDTVDYLSGGVVDIDFDDGTFSANIGVDGYAQAGASIGDNGVTAAYDTLGQQSTFGLGDQGIESSITAGVDYGPLPFVDGHVNLSPDGGVDVAGHLQGTVPTRTAFSPSTPIRVFNAPPTEGGARPSTPTAHGHCRRAPTSEAGLVLRTSRQPTATR